MGYVLSPQALYKMNTKRSGNKSASYPRAASDLAVCLWRNSPSPVYTCPADAWALWLLPSHPPHQGKTVCALTCLIWSLQREREREKKLFLFIRHGLKVSGVCWRRKKNRFKNEKLITFNDTVLCPMRIKYSTPMAVLCGQTFLNNVFNCITDWFPTLSSCGSCMSLGCMPLGDRSSHIIKRF